MNAKQVYETPHMRCHGQFETITQGGATGNKLDQALPTGGIPTFS